MNLKFNYNYIIIILVSFFFFFWGVDLERAKLPYFLAWDYKYEFYERLSNIRLSYFIVLLLIPITYSCVKKKTLLFNLLEPKYIAV